MTPHVDVRRALAEAAGGIESAGPSAWRVTLDGGRPGDVRVAVRDGWLAVDAPLYDGVPSPAALLARNATLGGGARIVLAPSPRVRADVALDDDARLVRRVAEACAGVARARAGCAGRDVAAPLAPGDPVARSSETGWRVVPREPGVAAVELAIPAGFRQALVAARGGGTVVDVDALDALDAAPASDAAREACALLLLRVAGAVRLVRPTGVARLTVAFDGDVTAGELAHAFAALSVACRHVCREAAVLAHDEDIARAYVAHMKEEERRCRRQA